MDSKPEELKDKMYSWLVSEIKQAENTGVEVKIDGRQYSLDNVEQLKHVMENSYYMKSYTGDEHGRIVRIDFERITSVWNILIYYIRLKSPSKVAKNAT